MLHLSYSEIDFLYLTVTVVFAVFVGGTASLSIILVTMIRHHKVGMGIAKISAVRSLADICFLHVLIRLIRCVIVSVCP